MRRASRQAAAPDRISLSLPPEPTSIQLARTAAVGLLQHRAGGEVLGARLAALTADLLGAGLARARRRDRLVVHFDVGAASVLTTVEVRRRGPRHRSSFLETRSLNLD